MTSEFGIAVHALVYLNHKAKTLSSRLHRPFGKRFIFDLNNG